MLIARAESVLLSIDFQSRLMPMISEGRDVVRRAALLAQAARKLAVPSLATEQNPAGLGPTVADLAPFFPQPLAKRHFDACADGLADLLPAGRGMIVALGCEAHVCVLQTLLGLRMKGFQVSVVSDAVGSRRPTDKETALDRLRAAGCAVVTAEMVVFEWLRHCDDPSFRDVLQLIKQT